MPCEFYKEALTDAAAANEALSRELTAHLDACAACRTFFAEEQQLFAVLDSGVHAAANTEVPASLLSQVRARLDEQKVSNSSWIRVGAVLASAVLILIGMVFLQKMRSSVRQPASPANVAEAKPVVKEPAIIVPSEVQPGRRPAERRSAGAAKENHRRVVGESARTAEVAVLVPAREKEEVDKFVAAVRKGTVKASDFPTQSSASPSTETGELAPLGIPRIEIKPLAAVSEDSAPTR